MAEGFQKEDPNIVRQMESEESPIRIPDRHKEKSADTRKPSKLGKIGRMESPIS